MSGRDSRKGLDDIINFSEGTDTEILIIGITEEQRQSLARNMLAYTRTNDAGELRWLYAIAYYYINLNYEDNYPTTIIEAFASGTPVITCRTGGSVEAADETTEVELEKGAYQSLDVKAFFAETLCCDRSKLFTEGEMLKAYLPLY